MQKRLFSEVDQIYL